MEYIIKKIDLFGKYYLFEENRSPRYTTIPTRIFTVLILVTCVIIGFLFGNEIYERNNPTVISGEENLNVNRVYTDDFPMILMITNGKGTHLTNARKHINMEITKMDIANDYSITYNYIEGFKPCNKTSFNNKYESLLNKLFLSEEEGPAIFYCINQNNIYFQNDYGDRNSTMVNIRFSQCDNKTQICGDEEEREMYFSDLYIALITFNAFIDPENYNQPIVYYESTITQQVGISLLKRNFIKVEKQIFISNQGWILDNSKRTEFLTVKSINKEVNTSTNGDFYWITLEGLTRRGKTIRSYMKIQDLLAKIGGFFNALYLFVYCLTKHYINFSFYKNIYQHFIIKASSKQESSYNSKYTFKQRINSLKNVKSIESMDLVIRRMVSKEKQGKENKHSSIAKSCSSDKSSFKFSFKDNVFYNKTDSMYKHTEKNEEKTYSMFNNYVNNINANNNNRSINNYNNHNEARKITNEIYNKINDYNKSMSLVNSNENNSNNISKINNTFQIANNNSNTNKSFNQYILPQFSRSEINYKNFSTKLNINKSNLFCSGVSDQNFKNNNNYSIINMNNNEHNIVNRIISNNSISPNINIINNGFSINESNLELKPNNIEFGINEISYSDNKNNHNTSFPKNPNNSFNRQTNSAPTKDIPSRNLINPNICVIDNKLFLNQFNNKIIDLNDNNIDFTEYLKEFGYFEYIWSDLICCRKKMLYQRQAVRSVLSFNNLLELSYKHYINNNYEEDDNFINYNKSNNNSRDNKRNIYNMNNLNNSHCISRDKVNYNISNNISNI